MQCVAVCCSTWQCVAVCCSVLQHAAACCSVLQCANGYVHAGSAEAAQGSVLQYVAVCNTLTCSVVYVAVYCSGCCSVL